MKYFKNKTLFKRQTNDLFVTQQMTHQHSFYSPWRKNTALFECGRRAIFSCPYTIFQQDGTNVAGVMQMSAEWGEAPPHWMGYIAVDDIDATATKVETLGGNILVPPTDIPTVGRFSVVQDPGGATISFITFLPM